MSDSIDLDALLRTDPRDVGCDQALTLLHVYAELFVKEPEAASRRFPGIVVHLHACAPCTTDFEGLLALITGPRTGRAPHRPL